MNRQMRRIQEKSDKKQDKEREEKRAARRAKIMARRESRKGTVTKASSVQASPAVTPSRPRNRFLGVLAVVNVMVVLYGGLVTPADASMTDRIMYALLFVTLGYFICRWLIGRGVVERALTIGVFTGITLALGIELAKFFVSGAAPDLLMPLLVLPALLVGAFGGVYIDRKLHGPA